MTAPNRLNKMNDHQIVNIADRLVQIDQLELWTNELQGYGKKQRNAIYRIAEPRWLQRAVDKRLILLHPEMVAELKSNDWRETYQQRKFIWGSYLACMRGEDSKSRFREIKRKLVNKYSNKWWFEAYKIQTATYAISMRLEELPNRIGSVTMQFAQISAFMAGNVQEEVNSMLKKLPTSIETLMNRLDKTS